MEGTELFPGGDADAGLREHDRFQAAIQRSNELQLRLYLIERPVQERFDYTIEHLAGLMKKYDELKPQIQQFRPRHNPNPYTEQLAQIDLSLPLEEQPEEFAYAALGAYIRTQRWIRIENAQTKLEKSVLFEERFFRGKKVRVTPAHDDAPALNVKKRSGRSLGERQEFTGHIGEIFLRPNTAWLKVEKRNKRCLVNLINRERDYALDYNVEFLS